MSQVLSLQILHGTIVMLALLAIVARGYHETLIEHAGLVAVVFGGLGMACGVERGGWVEIMYVAGIATYGAGTAIKHRLKYLAALDDLRRETSGDDVMLSRVRNWAHHVAGDVEGLSLHQDTVVIDRTKTHAGSHR